ncbi:unnamed protein product [Thelazia callipaeda]|uniref:HMG box domain-containing protein n=1 Tax=Thelazia callipaeda TaxID=103827 RepID=A0A158RB72_THECL|nr:unnamed protein product [Thelazia callipaeda]
MPVVSTNGFLLFAQELRIKITGHRQYHQNDLISSYLSHIVTPLWERLTSEEKKVWKDRAKMKRHIEEYFTLMHQPRMSAKRKRREMTQVLIFADLNIIWKIGRQSDERKENYEAKNLEEKSECETVNEEKEEGRNEKLDEFDENDYPEDLMIGIPLNQLEYDSEGNSFSTLKSICQKWRESRFQYSSIIGPWRLNNKIQRRRAEFHANETHQIHLDMPGGKTSKIPTQNSVHYLLVAERVKKMRNCLREILGRCEPTIAQHQGISVGLYQEGIEEFDSDAKPLSLTTFNVNFAHESCDRKKALPNDIYGSSNFTNRRSGYTNSQYSAKHSQTSQPVFAANKEGRRWLICLNHEYEKVRASLDYLKQAQKLCYEGFPTTEDRFWYADAVVDALAEFANGTPNPEYKLWMDIFGKRQPFEFNTPWERRANVFCHTHSITRNCCCASATAIRSCFAMFFALHEPLDLTLAD